MRVGVGVRVAVIVGVGVSVGAWVCVSVGSATMVATTPASIVASMSGVGVSVCVGSAAITIACTVASRFGVVGVGTMDWGVNPQAMTNMRIGAAVAKIFIARILTWKVISS